MSEREIVPRSGDDNVIVAGDITAPPKDDTSAIWLGAILAIGIGGAIWYSRRGEKLAGFS